MTSRALATDERIGKGPSLRRTRSPSPNTLESLGMRRAPSRGTAESVVVVRLAVGAIRGQPTKTVRSDAAHVELDVDAESKRRKSLAGPRTRC
jgi:hypothetical protein